jgi:hypothetical protein
MHLLQDVATIHESMHFVQMNNIATMSAELKNALQVHSSTVGKADTRLTLAIKHQEEALHVVGVKLAILSQGITTITTSEKILRTLVFEEMDSRVQQIHKEYPATFSWLFDDNRTPLPTWIRTGYEVFWITGKAGSGKSTLMKFLAEHTTTKAMLRTWAVRSKRDLTTAAFYFWHSGSEMQTSQKGLLQSLLYQVLSQCADMVEVVTPKARWEATKSGGLRSWRFEELTDAFDNLILHGNSLSKCFCFFIDGLDEYHDDFGDYGRLLDTLDNLAKTPWIKICVSSRPWNVFNDALGQNDRKMLVVHDFTRPDMDIFIRGMLEENTRFAVLVKKDPRVWHLADQLRDRAQGVFLWVFLVVRRLLRLVGEMQHMEKDTTLNALQIALDELPSDLDEYFKHMIDTIEKAHRVHTAGTFKLAIYAAPLPLIAFWNLPMVMERPKSVLEAPIGDDSVGGDGELVRRTTDTVNTWCKDLLEVCKFREHEAGTVSEMDYQIDFLHRTVRDFLVDNHEVQTMFSTHLSPNFDPCLTLLRLQIAQLKILRIDEDSKQGSTLFVNAVQRCLSLAKSCERGRNIVDPALLAELDRIGIHYSASWHIPQDADSLTIISVKPHWSHALARTPDGPMNDSAITGTSTFLGLTVAYDLVAHVRHRLASRSESLDKKKGAHLLNYALLDIIPTDCHTPSYDMVLLLLQGGASPNFDAAGRRNSDTTPWILFLRRCYHEGSSDLWPIAKLLLEFCADPNVKVEEGYSQKVERLHAAKSFTPRIRHVAVPEYVSVRQCLSRCCNDPSELDESLEKALELRSVKSQEGAALSILQRVGYTIARNFVQRQRRR